MKLKDLVNQRRVVESEIAELQRELGALDVLIERQRKRDGLTPDTSSSQLSLRTNGNDEKQRRTRGILKAAKMAVSSFSEPFTRTQLLEKIELMTPALAGKIRVDALRLTMRTLIKDNHMIPLDRVSEETGEALYSDVK